VHSACSVCKKINRETEGERITWNGGALVAGLTVACGGDRALVPGGAVAVSNGEERDERD
jgi:hypothetical protein